VDRVKTVLVAIDFSACSADAFRQATRIAAWNAADLHVLHVIDAPAQAPVPHAFMPYELPTHDDLIHNAHRRWEDFAPARESKVRPRFTATVGSPRSEILRAAGNLKPDLLVLGATSHLDRRRGIGTTAAACARHARTNVLLVEEGRPGPFREVAAFVDFSETSREVVAQAIRLSARHEAVLHVVHMYDDPWRGVPRTAVVVMNMPDFEAQMARSVEQRLREFCSPLSTEMARLKVRFQAFQHDAHWKGYGEGIAGFVVRHGIELAVLGVRSTWNTRDFLMGTTAERVCRDAPCSLLTIRPLAGTP
jgi:nucleotide-binding universal stress UspA family protein